MIGAVAARPTSCWCRRTHANRRRCERHLPRPLGATGRAARLQSGASRGRSRGALASRPVGAAQVSLVRLESDTSITFSARVDARGRFRVDSLPAGHYLVQVSHPTLDSLDVALPTDRLVIADGRTTRSDLSLPSGARAPGHRVSRASRSDRRRAWSRAASWTPTPTLRSRSESPGGVDRDHDRSQGAQDRDGATGGDPSRRTVSASIGCAASRPSCRSRLQVQHKERAGAADAADRHARGRSGRPRLLAEHALRTDDRGARFARADS